MTLKQEQPGTKSVTDREMDRQADEEVLISMCLPEYTAGTKINQPSCAKV